MRNDDGAGLAAVHLWQKTYSGNLKSPPITVEQVELPGLGLLNLMEGFDAAILVDAVQNDAPSGTVYKLNESDLLGFDKSHQTAHGWGVVETLQLGRKLGLDLPSQILLIGIVGEDFSPGNTLSPSVRSALDRIARVIEDSAKIILHH